MLHPKADLKHFKWDLDVECGSTLLETVESLAIGALLAVLVCASLIGLTRSETTLTRLAESNTMWLSASRVIRQDVHAAQSLQSLYGDLVIREADGRVYRYLVNTEGELVRVQSGGGTAVVALGVKTMDCSVQSSCVMLTLTFANGQVNSLAASSLGAS